jgi:hypothetical protein
MWSSRPNSVGHVLLSHLAQDQRLAHAELLVVVVNRNSDDARRIDLGQRAAPTAIIEAVTVEIAECSDVNAGGTGLFRVRVACPTGLILNSHTMVVFAA